MAAALFVVVSTLVVSIAGAHQSPVGCNGSALAVSIFTDKPGGIHPGETVTYSVFVSNANSPGFIACDVTNATVTFTRPDGTTGTLATGLNFPGGTPSTFVGTFTYTLPANSTANTISASATVTGTSHTPAGDVPGSGMNAVVIAVIRPATTLTKTASATSVRTGGSITYTFTEANTGNVDITGVSVVDSKCAPLVRGADAPGNNDATLNPGETWTFTCTRTLTLADADPGSNPPSVSNSATATGSVGGTPAPIETSNAVVVGIRNPATVLTKTRTGPATVPPNTPVTYTYTEQNTGSDPISNVTVVDDRCSPLTRGADAPGNNNAILDPGETWTFTCTTTFPTSGAVTNTVTANGTDTIDGQPAPTETAQATVTVARVQPSIGSQAAAVGTGPGATLTDTATITNGTNNPTGTAIFRLYSDANCSALLFTSAAIPVQTTGATTATATSAPPFTTTGAGTYFWTVDYSGDASNLPVSSPCGAANESSTLAKATPIINTVANPQAATVGNNIHDTATISNAFNPTGSVVFRLFSDTACATQVFTSTNPVSTTGTPAAPSTTGTARSDDFPVAAPGTYHWTATYLGDPNNAPTAVTPCLDPSEQVVVGQASPAITTTASPSVPVGGTIRDVATVTGGSNPTGDVAFSLYGPDDAACATSIFDSRTSLVGGAATSGGFITAKPGTYRWRATYLGDANNAGAGPTPCADPAEQVVVTVAAPTLATVASPAVPAGNRIHDVANLSGGNNPGGRVTFQLYGPADPTCAGPALFTSDAPVVNSSATSGEFVANTPGTYRWRATYNGDPNNAPFGPTPCADPAEAVVVGQATPTIATTASGPVSLGSGTPITDRATLTGAVNPTGNVVFRLFKDDATCAAASQVATSTSAVNASGVADSAPFTPTAPGTYRWTAQFLGDPNNAPAGPTACTDALEQVIVRPAGPAIVTHASAPVPVGGTITDTATLSGGSSPTGTITYDLFGPTDVNCAGTPAFTTTRTVTGNGDYTSAPFTTNAAGAYRWVVRYSGDPNNAPAGPTSCSDALETTNGLKVTPTLVTHASSGSVGGQVFDTATLSNAFSPTGTITFQLFNNDSCTAPAVFTSTKPVTGNGDVVSDSFILPAPGLYHFRATYSGDGNNNPQSTSCSDPAEAVGAGRAAVSLSTRASGSVTVGNTIFDTATIGGFNPTGTVTFTLFGPDDTNCARPPIFNSTKTVNGVGAYPSDSFTPSAPGVYRWIATYSGDANNSSAATPCGDPLEQVTVTALPTIAIEKTASPLSLPVPGGTFQFTLVVTNTSNVALTIRSLTDSIYGDTTTIPGTTCNTAIGTVLAPSPGPGNTYTCHFPGDFRGPAGAAQTDTATVVATDVRGNTVRASDNATVTITPVPPSITTVKSAAPPSLPEPGGLFTFSYSVTNTGPEAVTITSIVDDVYGDLNGRGTCAVGARLAPNGGTYSCTFTGNFFGNAGAAQTDTITTIGRNDRGEQVVSKASATVTLTNVLPTIQIIKTPDPTSRPEPGGTFRFTVTVTNTSFEPITTTSLVDNIYGDLNGRGTCAIGVVLAPNGGRYTCAFDGDFRGRAGDSQTDTVTVVAIDNDNTSVTAKASATVTLTPVNVPPVFLPPPPLQPVVVIQQTPAPVIQQTLVRTGTDALRQARVAITLLLLGMILVWASWRFGFGGGLDLAPSGPPDVPPPGPRRGDGGLRFDGGGGRFGPAPPRPRPPAPAAPVRGRHAPDPSAFDSVLVRRPAVPPVSAPPAPVAPATPAPPTEVLVPTVVRPRMNAGLDAAALDAANADPFVGERPPVGGSPARRGRTFGGR